MGYACGEQTCYYTYIAKTDSRFLNFGLIYIASIPLSYIRLYARKVIHISYEKTLPHLDTNPDAGLAYQLLLVDPKGGDGLKGPDTLTNTDVG